MQTAPQTMMQPGAYPSMQQMYMYPPQYGYSPYMMSYAPQQYEQSQTQKSAGCWGTGLPYPLCMYFKLGIAVMVLVIIGYIALQYVCDDKREKSIFTTILCWLAWGVGKLIDLIFG